MGEVEALMENRCKFWLPKKNRFCANVPLSNSWLCGNHTDTGCQWIQCPIDPSHTVLIENLEGHKKRCPLLKQVRSLSLQTFYRKGINAGSDEDDDDNDEEGKQLQQNGFRHSSSSGLLEGSHSIATATSEMKRNAVFSMTATQLYQLFTKILSVHASICSDIQDSYKIPEACCIWINRQIDRKLPFQEKHVRQQASILGNLEQFGVLKDVTRDAEHKCKCDRWPLLNDDVNITSSNISNVPTAVVEFGAGRGYLTQMLADCYGISKVLLVERKSYKLKADRSLRQKEGLILERLRIDIEDLNLNAVEFLQGIPYLAIGKHLCGPATDMTLRCCLVGKYCEGGNALCQDGTNLRGLAIATCCHHLCQWKHYINKSYLTNLGITKGDFHAMTWFTSWAVDADYSSDLSDAAVNLRSDLLAPITSNGEKDVEGKEDVEGIIKDLKAMDRAAIGFMCKDIIDMGRLMWLKHHHHDHQLAAQLVKYVPFNISPENRLLLAKLSPRTI